MNEKESAENTPELIEEQFNVKVFKKRIKGFLKNFISKIKDNSDEDLQKNQERLTTITINQNKVNSQRYPPFTLKEWEQIFIAGKLEGIDESRLITSLKKGINDSIRGKVWMLLSKSFDSYKKNKELYPTLINSKERPSEEIITKDIPRTFLNLDKTQTIQVDSEKLYNVLTAYSIYDKDVGYCQGTNTIVAMFLEYIGREEFCYWTFNNLMQIHQWREFYLSHTPKLFRMIDILKENIKKKLPELFKHFVRLNFLDNLGILFTHYFLTLFTYKCPKELSVRVIDLFWIYEEKIIFDVLLNIIQINQEKMKKMSSEDLLMYFNNDIIYDAVEKNGVDYIINMI